MKKYHHTVVLMTALLPTIGHKRLIQFAAELTHTTHVIVSGRSFEPIGVEDRVFALSNDISNQNVLFYTHSDDNAPQNPSGENDHQFWKYWKNVIRNVTELSSKDSSVAVVSSEPYGQIIADMFKWDFIPYDMNRQIDNVRGSLVRGNIVKYWNQILPTFQHKLKKSIVLFGAESCGKTTMAKYLAKQCNGYYIPEWARSYLESTSPELTSKKMDIISRGQFASDIHADDNLNDRPVLFLDTDIFSTIGYYELWDKNYKRDDLTYFINTIDFNHEYHPADLYIIMNDDIPFEKDVLRYGENKRETNTQYWVDLAKQENLNYVVMKSTSKIGQQMEAIQYVAAVFEDNVKSIRDFKRN